MSIEIKALRVEKLHALEYLYVIINTGWYKKNEIIALTHLIYVIQ